jgi:hypothetical protein
MICEIKNGLFFVSAFIEQRQRFLFGVGCHYATDTKKQIYGVSCPSKADTVNLCSGWVKGALVSCDLSQLISKKHLWCRLSTLSQSTSFKSHRFRIHSNIPKHIGLFSNMNSYRIFIDKIFIGINCRLLSSALAGIDRRLLLGSTVGSCSRLLLGSTVGFCWDRPQAARWALLMETVQGGLALRNDAPFRCFSLLFKGTNTGVTG